MKKIDINVLISRTVTVELEDNEVEVIDCGYEYDPGEPDGKGEYWEAVEYKADIREVVLRTGIVPEGWTLDEVELSN